MEGTPRGTDLPPVHRRTLSGKRVAADHRPLTWHELVQKPAKVEPKQRPSRALLTGASVAVKADGTPAEVGPVVEFPADYRGGRSPRPSSVYSKALRLALGAALTARRERKHPQRVAKRNAIREAKARGQRMGRAA